MPAFSWGGSLSPLLLAPLALIAVTAAVAPQDILDVSPAALHFTAWMKSALPFIAAHAGSTSYPQVALLVQCLTWALLPWCAFVWCVQGCANYPRLLARNRAMRGPGVGIHVFLIAGMPPLFLGALYVIAALPGDPSSARGFTTSSRLGLAFLCCFGLYGTAMAIGGWPALIRLFIDLHLRRENKNDR